MREIALHIMDLVENAIRAQATTIAVAVSVDPPNDCLRIVIEDNGRGLSVAAEKAADPFYTTKPGKRTGLGLSLFRGAAEQAGGRMTLGPSDLGGVRIEAVLGLRHVDRNPLGDLAGTLSGMVLTNPEVDFQFHLELGTQACRIRVADLAAENRSNGRGALALAQRVAEMIRVELDRAQALTGIAL